MFTLGQVVNHPINDIQPELIADDPGAAHLLTSPWCRAAVLRQAGISLKDYADRQSSPFNVSNRDLSAHALLLGSPGGGKTRARQAFIADHLDSAGSTLVFDPKPEDVHELAAMAQGAGLSPIDTTFFLPQEGPAGIPP